MAKNIFQKRPKIKRHSGVFGRRLLKVEKISSCLVWKAVFHKKSLFLFASNTGIFWWIFQNFSEQLFSGTPPCNCFCNQSVTIFYVTLCKQYPFFDGLPPTIVSWSDYLFEKICKTFPNHVQSIFFSANLQEDVGYYSKKGVPIQISLYKLYMWYKKRVCNINGSHNVTYQTKCFDWTT